MFPTHNLAPFLLAAIVLIAVPGPSVMFVVGRGLSLGRRAALATVLGNALGLALQLALVALGLGDAIARSATARLALTLVGGSYLVFLGSRAIRDREIEAALFRAPASARPMGAILREGLIVGATNPKGLVIFAAVLPQFVERSRGHLVGQLLVLGAICIAIALVSDGAWGIAAGSAGRWLGRSVRRIEQFQILAGTLLIALGIALAVDGLTTDTRAQLTRSPGRPRPALATRDILWLGHDRGHSFKVAPGGSAGGTGRGARDRGARTRAG